MAGALQVYTGTTGVGSGFLDDFDGRWVYLSSDSFRTIGNASSNADIAAAWLQTLFEHIWSNYDNTRSPILTSAGSGTTRGVSATADWNANRRLTLPDFRGRVIIGAGTGSSLTARAKSATGGAETHTLAASEIPAHQHTVNTRISASGGGGSGDAMQSNGSGSAGSLNTGIIGSGGAHNNMQPWAAEHLLISAGVRP
jgi:hypothetical protein